MSFARISRPSYSVKKAQKKVHDDGFAYKKGHSRSKRHGVEQGKEISVDSQPKRAKTYAEERQRRIQDILADTNDLDTRITFKQRRIEQATHMKNYRECDQVAEETGELKSRRRQLNMELKTLELKEKKSVWYQSKKDGKKKSDDTTTESMNLDISDSFLA